MKSELINGHYKNFTRMSPSNLENLLGKIRPRISRQNMYFYFAILIKDG